MWYCLVSLDSSPPLSLPLFPPPPPPLHLSVLIFKRTQSSDVHEIRCKLCYENIRYIESDVCTESVALGCFLYWSLVISVWVQAFSSPACSTLRMFPSPCDFSVFVYFLRPLTFLFLYVFTKVLFFQELVYTNIHTRQKAPQVRSCEYGGNPTPPLVTGVVDEKFRDSWAHVKIRPYCPVRIPVIHFWYFSIFSTSDLQRPKQSEFYHKANVRQCTRGIWTTGKT